MINMNHDGIYYYDLDIPIQQGVYPATALCYYQAGSTYNYASSYYMYNGSISAGTLDRTYVLDASYLLGDESPSGNGNPRRLWAEYNFSNSSKLCNISAALLQGITVSWTGRWNSNLANDFLTFWIYNYSSSRWIGLDNTVVGSGTGSKSVSNSIALNNLTKAGFVNSSGGNIRIKINDTSLADTTTSAYDVDYLSVSCDSLLTPVWQEVRGSSELHVTSEYNYVLEFNSFSYESNKTNTYNLTVSSGVSEFTENQIILFPLYFNQPCSYVLSVSKLNATSGLWKNVSFTYKQKAAVTREKCEVLLVEDLDVGQNYYYSIRLKDNWQYITESKYFNMLYIHEYLYLGCEFYKNINGYPNYTVPLLTIPNYDNQYALCNYYLNQFDVLNRTIWDKFIIKFMVRPIVYEDEKEVFEIENDVLSTDYMFKDIELTAQNVVNKVSVKCIFNSINLNGKHNACYT
jgi:hypothetical protein